MSKLLRKFKSSREGLIEAVEYLHSLEHGIYNLGFNREEFTEKKVLEALEMVFGKIKKVEYPRIAGVDHVKVRGKKIALYWIPHHHIRVEDQQEGNTL